MMKNTRYHVCKGSLATWLCVLFGMHLNGLHAEGLPIEEMNSQSTCCEQVICAPVPCCTPVTCCVPTPCSEPCPEPCCEAPCYCIPCGNLRLSVRAGGFYSTNRCFRENFGRVGAFYGGQLTYTLCGCATLFLNGDYYHRKGRPCCAIRKSTVQYSTGSIGVCFPVKMCTCVEPYVGIGAVVGRVRFRDKIAENHLIFSSVMASSSDCGIELEREKHSCHTSKTAFGGVLKSGIIIPFAGCWFGEVFCDYLYLPVHFEKRRNLGGAKIGGGVGVTF